MLWLSQGVTGGFTSQERGLDFVQQQGVKLDGMEREVVGQQDRTGSAVAGYAIIGTL